LKNGVDPEGMKLTVAALLPAWEASGRIYEVKLMAGGSGNECQAELLQWVLLHAEELVKLFELAATLTNPRGIVAPAALHRAETLGSADCTNLVSANGNIRREFHRD
jgi:hypothetical protein